MLNTTTLVSYVITGKPTVKLVLVSPEDIEAAIEAKEAALFAGLVVCVLLEETDSGVI